VGKHLSITVNKQVWMDCFGADVPTEDIISREIIRLKVRLKKIKLSNSSHRNQSYSRLCNTLQRQQKMLAAVKDGQPWAWMLYPSDNDDTSH